MMSKSPLIILIFSVLLIVGCQKDEPTDPIPPPPEPPIEASTPDMLPNMDETSMWEVVDIRKDNSIGKLVSQSIQGLVNKDAASLYLIHADHHYDLLNENGQNFEEIETVSDFNSPAAKTLLIRYKEKINKIYIWDPNKDWTWNIGLMLGAQNDGIPLTKELSDWFIDNGFDGEVQDIRNTWSNRIEAYRWAITNLLPNCSNEVIFSAGLRDDWLDNPWRIFDYAYATNGFTFWLDDEDSSESQVIDEIAQIGDYPVGTPVMGYAQSGDDLLKIVNKYGIGYVVSDYYANGSIWSSLSDKSNENSWTQEDGKAVQVQDGKIYVSVIISDGDNIQFDQNSLFTNWFNDPARGLIPVGTTLGAALADIDPMLFNWFYENKTSNDELLAGPSGFQFIYLDDYPDTYLNDWLALNKNWMKYCGFKTACVWHATWNSNKFDKYILTSGLSGLFDGNDKVGTQVKDNVAVINQGEHIWEKGQVYSHLSSVNADENSPKFLNIYLIAASYGEGNLLFTNLNEEVDKLNTEYPGVYEFILPKDMAATVVEYNN